MIRTYTIDITTAGTAGSATGSGTTSRPVNGMIAAIKIDFTSQASTADTTIVDGHGQPILTLTNVNADGWYYPHPEIHDNTGAAVNKQTCPYAVDSYVTASIAQSNPGSAVVTLLVNEGGRG